MALAWKGTVRTARVRRAGRGVRFPACVAWLALLLSSAVAGAAEYTIGAPPAWVHVAETLDVAAAAPEGQVSDGAWYLLTDTQQRIDAKGRTIYRRIAAKALSAKGVESIADIGIRFDPAWSTLTLHSIDVVRDGRVIPKLATAQVRVLQRETALDYRIFDGTRTASVFLDDVRVGDVVDYSYSIDGANPVFGGREAGSALLQYTEPVERLRVRLLYPARRPLSIALRNTQMQPASTRNGSEHVLEWDLHRVAARTVEDGTPGWHDTRPLLQWSEYADWAAVATWAWPLYESSQRPSATVNAEARRIVRDLPTESEQRMLAVLRFVQSEIRYLAISIGPGSHAPNAAERVLERRFGDCKDKAQLMIAMLSALGIEARAALVDTALQRGVRDLQPSPNAFDHVVVRVRIGDRIYWLDPTRSPQNGDAAHLQQANHGVALIIDPATSTLADMQGTPIARRTVTGIIDASAGFDQPVDYTVTTVAEGARADGLRAELAASGLDRLQQQYLNFYARYYPDIESAAPVRITEDASANRVTTVESYRIARYWTKDGDTRRADIETPDLDEVLRQPAVVVRHAPLQLAHPQELLHHTELRLPEAWSLDAETTRVDDPAFLFERSTRLDGRRILITDHFQTRVAEVSGADTPRYAANLARAQQETGLRLTWRAPDTREGSALQRVQLADWPALADAAGVVDRGGDVRVSTRSTRRWRAGRSAPAGNRRLAVAAGSRRVARAAAPAPRPARPGRDLRCFHLVPADHLRQRVLQPAVGADRVVRTRRQQRLAGVFAAALADVLPASPRRAAALHRRARGRPVPARARSVAEQRGHGQRRRTP